MKSLVDISSYDGSGAAPLVISFPEFHIEPHELGRFLLFGRISRVSGPHVKAGIWWWCHSKGRNMERTRPDIELVYQKSENEDFLRLVHKKRLCLDDICNGLKFWIGKL